MEQQSTKHKAQSTKLLLTLLLLSNFFIQSCKKDKNQDLNNVNDVKPNVVTNQSIPIENGVIVNPFSIKNMRSAREVYGSTDIPEITQEHFHLMIKFETDQVNETTMQYMEDTTIAIHAIPLNAPELYQSGASEEDLENLKDGSLYTTVPINHEMLQHIQFEILDTLYKPKEDQTDLEILLMLHAGYLIMNGDSALPTAKINVRKAIRPEGNITFTDEQLGTQNNMGVSVWAIKFGFTVSANADHNGHYKILTDFHVGTTIGLHYKNSRVNVKPFNTTGNWLTFIPKLIGEFAVGSKFYQGWVDNLDLRNKNIFIGAHRELRTWAHIMNSVYHHDNYCKNEGITKSPTALVIYAHWADNPGSASAPMLGHMSVLKAYADPLISKAFGVNGMLNNYPSLFNALFGLLPDITLKTTKDISGRYNQFSCETMQTLFHELSHASHFNKVGSAFWINVINQSLSSEGCGGYGCGNWQNSSNGQDKYLQVTEAWAEFLGQRFALAYYGNNGEIFSSEFGGHESLLDLRDDEHFFTNDWICKGVFNDLMDGFNGAETWDNINGRTVAQLYGLLSSSVINIEDYQTAYVNAYGNSTNFQNIVNNNLP